MNELVVKSPAKINIGLNIINKRNDGFHDLETIFYPVNLYDEIRFTKSDEFSFNSNDDNLNKEKTNLIIKAKESLEKHFNIQLPANVFLNKHIPIGAGLGGGSSNAASTLKSLIKLYDLKIEENELSKIALQLGSDVPFFLKPVPSFAESRGEILYSINLKLDKYILIVNPVIHVATKWAFGLIKPNQTKESLKSFIGKNEISIDDVIKIASNDFEKIVFEHFPEIKDIKEKMIYFGANHSMMTGTGSTVWAMFDDEDAAYQTELFFKCKNYFTFIQGPI
jgi:4-diphosphocytidyl-2-C-methyl-D-erythritol kinase